MEWSQAELLQFLELKETCRTHCPVELLQNGVLSNRHQNAACLGTRCGVCSSGLHLRNQCPHKITLPGVCFFCYLLPTLLQKEIHTPAEFGTRDCPWMAINQTLMVMAVGGDPRVMSELGDLTPRSGETKEQLILRKLWETPARGDLLPLGVHLLVRLSGQGR